VLFSSAIRVGVCVCVCVCTCLCVCVCVRVCECVCGCVRVRLFSGTFGSTCERVCGCVCEKEESEFVCSFNSSVCVVCVCGCKCSICGYQWSTALLAHTHESRIRHIYDSACTEYFFISMEQPRESRTNESQTDESRTR